ncbi:MAG: hypothetical protein LQ345_000869 [Seirophora villosa]|nr:MAG: hypothetical protein LQ345_000869 [Seirophora villosa]
MPRSWMQVPSIHFVPALLGSAFATIGDDNKFKLWREDPSQAFQSGRRFRCVFSQSPSNQISYVSFDFRTVKHEVWLVLVSRDGLLSLLEPSESESLHQWKEVDTVFPFGQQGRASETVFRLSLHQAETPCYGALSAGVDPKAISLCLSADISVKILRAIRSDEGNYRIHEMLEVNAMASKINDISWAPGSIRTHDLIAAACHDGRVRVYALTTLQGSQSTSTGLGPGQDAPPRERHSSSLASRHNPSGIGAGLADVSRGGFTRRPSSEVRIQHLWKEIAVLPHEAGAPVWRVRWTHDGSTIASTGDSGKLHLWKQDLKGDFIENATSEPSLTTDLPEQVTVHIVIRTYQLALVMRKVMFREDVLTSRGANPRTGVISPYIFNETSEASDENDYVHGGRARLESDLKIGAGERWRQDELGWSLVGSANALNGSLDTFTSTGTNATSAASKQGYVSKLLGWDPNVESAVRTQGGKYSTIGQGIPNGISASANTQEMHNLSANRKSPSPRQESQSPSRFQIPRKDVGSSTDSPRLLPSSPPHVAPGSDSNVHGGSSEDEALHSPLPHRLDSVVTRSPGSPAAVSLGRSPHLNQPTTLRPGKRYGSLGLYEAQQNLGPYPLDVFAAGVDSLPLLVNPNLKSKYRRPKELLPARLWEHAKPKHQARPAHTGCSPAKGEGAILEPRPRFKRVQATTAVPVAQSVKHAEVTEAKASRAPPALSQGAEIPSCDRDKVKEAASRSAGSGLVSASTRAARKAFDNVQEILESQAVAPDGITKSVSARTGSAYEQRHGAEASLKNRTSPKTSSAHTTPEDGSKQGKTQHTLLRRKSMRNPAEVRDTFLAFARELCALVDLERLMGQLVERVAHAALMFRRMPWAVQTLKSQDAKIWDYLLAVRYFLTTLLYLAILLGILRAVLKVLKVVVELGNCIWYPVGLLLTMARWVLLQ